MQFCAYRLRRGHVVLDMQSDVLSHLTTRLVAPLVPEGRHDIAMMVLEPVFELDGTRIEPSPSPRNLDTLELDDAKLAQGEIWVNYQNFQTGKPEKTAK